MDRYYQTLEYIIYGANGVCKVMDIKDAVGAEG